jgi:peptidylprolyl isomerase
MTKARKGDLVKVHYSGSLKDGYVFDSSFDKQPIDVKLGIGSVIPGFEEAIIGMKKGDRKKLTIPKDKAYGLYLNENLIEFSKTEIPADTNLKVGMKLELKSPSGELTNVIVKEIKEDKITLDANHPLAGKDLIFEIELVEIVKPS